MVRVLFAITLFLLSHSVVASEATSPLLDLYSIREIPNGEFETLFHLRQALFLRWETIDAPGDARFGFPADGIRTTAIESSHFTNELTPWTAEQAEIALPFLLDGPDATWSIPFPLHTFDLSSPISERNPSMLPSELGFTRAKVVGIRHVHRLGGSLNQRSVEIVFEYFDPKLGENRRTVLPLHQGHFPIARFHKFDPEKSESAIAGMDVGAHAVDAVRILAIDPANPKIIWVALSKEMRTALLSQSKSEQCFRAFPIQEPLLRQPDPHRRSDQYIEWANRAEIHEDNLTFASLSWENGGSIRLDYPVERKNDFVGLARYWRESLYRQIQGARHGGGSIAQAFLMLTCALLFGQ